MLILFLIPATAADNISIYNNTSIQKSVNTISNDGVINLETGTYSENNINIDKDLTIQGKGSPDKVIIDGENKNNILNVNSNVKLTVKNITFKNAFYRGDGGAISFYSTGKLVIENCIFLNNHVEEKDGQGLGGAVYTHGYSNKFVELDVKNSKFINNYAVTDGGAINTKFGTTIIDNCLFENNIADRDGGAISSRGTANFIIKNSVFNKNYALEWGGAINNWLADFEIKNCILTNNKAGTEGGAISTCGSNTIITYSKFENNTAEYGGCIHLHTDAYALNIMVNNNEILNNAGKNGLFGYINRMATGKFNFNDNYWGSDSPDLEKQITTNGVCDLPTTWLKLVSPTIKASDLTRGYNSPYDFTATFTDQYGRLLKNTPVSFEVNGKTYTSNTNTNGVATIALKLTKGTYSIPSLNPVTSDKITNSLKIIKRISSKNLIKDYLDSQTFKVKIIGDDGKTAKASEIITFKIAKKTYKVKTNKNGVASLKITLTPKKYTITTTYKGESVKNKITVKQVIKAKNISKKKSKVVKYSVTLKTSKGKSITSKKVTFNVNGKSYFAKTDKKGVAKVSLNTLKVGKNKITIKYVGTSIKKTITIQK